MRKFQIGKLPRAVREDLYNMHAMFNNPEATERGFYLKRVPITVIDLAAIPPQALYNRMSDEECDEYEDVVSSDPSLQFAIIADGGLLDGMHRITSRVRKNCSAMYALDMTGLIDTKSSGIVCPIQISEGPVEKTWGAPKDSQDITFSNI